jgi:hypothetical protein
MHIQVCEYAQRQGQLTRQTQPSTIVSRISRVSLFTHQNLELERVVWEATVVDVRLGGSHPEENI